MQISLRLLQIIPKQSQQEADLVLASSEEIKSFDTEKETPLSFSSSN